MRLASLQILSVLRILWLVAMARGQPKARLKCSKWCGSFHSAIDEMRIKSYRWTEPQCTQQAVIFTTKKSKEICANPKEEWVKKIMQKLDREKALAASPLPRAATSPAAAVPEEPGIFHKHVGLQEPAPPQATAATLERAPVPAASTEAASEPTMQNGAHFSAGSSPVTSGVVTQSEVISEANRESLTPTVHSTAAGVAPSQPSPYPAAPARGSDSTEEPVGDATNAAGDVHHTATTSNLDPASISKGLGRPGLSTNNPLDPVSARGSTSDTASGSLSSALPSTLNSAGISTVPSPPEAAPVPTQNPTTAIDAGRSVHANKNFCSSAFDTGTFDHLMPSGKQGPPDTLVSTSQMFPGQARAQATRSPSEPPAPSLLSGSQMHFIIPVTVAGGLIACSVAAILLYIKCRIRPETMSREMVQGLLYQKEGYQNNVYPMEVI